MNIYAEPGSGLKNVLIREKFENFLRLFLSQIVGDQFVQAFSTSKNVTFSKYLRQRSVNYNTWAKLVCHLFL